jgi:hypothetical protein
MYLMKAYSGFSGEPIAEQSLDFFLLCFPSVNRKNFRFVHNLKIVKKEAGVRVTKGIGFKICKKTPKTHILKINHIKNDEKGEPTR